MTRTSDGHVAYIAPFFPLTPLFVLSPFRLSRLYQSLPDIDNHDATMSSRFYTCMFTKLHLPVSVLVSFAQRSDC